MSREPVRPRPAAGFPLSSARWPGLAAILAVALLSAACAGGPAAPVKGAGGGAPRAAAQELPPPSRETLPNGLKLIVQEHWAADIVAVYMWIAAGVRDEAPDTLGYSHFQEHMLFKGTDRWGPGYIDRSVEGVGGRSNAVTSFDYTTFFMTLPADQLEAAVRILADMAFRSTFDPAEIDRERQVIFEEARIEQDNPRTALIRQLYALVFQGYPYGRPLLGTPATMSAATRDRLRAYYRQQLRAGQHGPGGGRPREARGGAGRRRAQLRAGGALGLQARAPVPPPRAPRRPDQPGRRAPGAAGHARMAWLGPKADDEAGNAVDLLTTIIAGSESARLVQSLRDRDRLVQNIRMSYSALAGAASSPSGRSWRPRTWPQVEQAVLAELRRVQEQGVHRGGATARRQPVPRSSTPSTARHPRGSPSPSGWPS